MQFVVSRISLLPAHPPVRGSQEGGVAKSYHNSDLNHSTFQSTEQLSTYLQLHPELGAPPKVNPQDDPPSPAQACSFARRTC